MRNMSLRICLLVAFTCLISVAAELSVGDEIDVLETKSGRKYEQVKVRGILPNGLKIMHSSGTATLPASELPQYEHLFAGANPEPVTVEPKAPVTPNPAWMPKSNSDVVDCSLFVKIKKAIGTDGSISSGNGSAFLCNHGSTTYIYSNAHNFDGAIEFTIEDKYGNKYDDFVSIESAADGQALRKESGQGGDVVRIRLEKYREKALTLDREPLTKHAINRKILVTGNTGGHGVITELDGIVTNIVDNYIIIHNAATEQGNSGSPIVDLETYKVIGILTWGGRLPNALQDIWIKKPPETREGLKSGSGLATVRFTPTNFKHLHQQRVIMNDLKKNVRLLGLLDTLIPTKQGLFVDKNAIVMGDYTVNDLLQESSNHPVVTELVYLDRFLSSKAESNIGISNQDMLKRYISCYKECIEHISSIRRGVENSSRFTYFMKCQLKRSRLLEVASAYEGLSFRCLEWYVTQTGTGGQALPLAKRLRLPEMRSGLDGLGIKDE